MWDDVLVFVFCYLLGSIPFAYLVTRLACGKDLRHHGDGNVGSRNVMQVAGLIPGYLALALDATKGAAGYWVGHTWGSTRLMVYLAGFAVLLGHCFPVWLGWRGGKGLASASGYLLQIWPYSVVAGVVVLLLARILLHSFSPAFGVAAGAFLAFSFAEGNDLWGAIFIVLFLGMAGVKRIFDLPHERALRASQTQNTAEGKVELAQAARPHDMH